MDLNAPPRRTFGAVNRGSRRGSKSGRRSLESGILSAFMGFNATFGHRHSHASTHAASTQVHKRAIARPHHDIDTSLPGPDAGNTADDCSPRGLPARGLAGHLMCAAEAPCATHSARH